MLSFSGNRFPAKVNRASASSPTLAATTLSSVVKIQGGFSGLSALFRFEDLSGWTPVSLVASGETPLLVPSPARHARSTTPTKSL